MCGCVEARTRPLPRVEMETSDDKLTGSIGLGQALLGHSNLNPTGEAIDWDKIPS